MTDKLPREMKVRNANHIKLFIRHVVTDSDVLLKDLAVRSGTSEASVRHALRINRKSTQLATLLPLIEAAGLELVLRRKQ